MRRLVVWWLKNREASLEGAIVHHQRCSLEHHHAAEEAIANLRSLRARIALREDPQVLLDEALRGSRIRL